MCVVSAAMASCEPHGFVFDHVTRRPNSASSRQRRTKSSANGDTRSSVRLSSLRSALSTSKNRQQDDPEASRKYGSGTSVDKTPSSGVFRSLFGRQVDNKSLSTGDLWVDVDLHRSASQPLDNLSVSSLEWVAAETPAANRRSDVERSTTDGEGHVAILRRSNSVRPATRRPAPMRVPSVPHQHQAEYVDDTLRDGLGVTTEQVWVRDSWTRNVSSHNSSRLSGDSGHVSCKHVHCELSYQPITITI